MDCAIDPVENKLVTADIASRTGYYICSYCRKRVGLRSGPSRKNYFAHWRGVPSSSCPYFISGSLGHVSHDKVQPLPTRQMDLRLLIKKGENAGAWWIEIVLPPLSSVSCLRQTRCWRQGTKTRYARDGLRLQGHG